MLNTTWITYFGTGTGEGGYAKTLSPFPKTSARNLIAESCYEDFHFSSVECCCNIFERLVDFHGVLPNAVV